MFKSVLVANRGEIAVRIMRTCRELGVRTVAVYSDVDRDALHVRRADEAVHIGPAALAESYLNLASVIDAARRAGVEALHPGYGFLSENPALPEACEAAGIAFVGPPSAAMRLMGDKSASRTLAAKCGVPVLPGVTGDGPDDATLVKRASEIGFPLMIKAAAGGGGRGMRLVPSAEGLPDALESARREASAVFGDGRLLLERAVVGGRHIEVQVLADACGNVVHLGERECSIQRRYQKVIEESPAPGMTPDLRKRMALAATDVARAGGYVNAGTVEFLLDRDGAFHFLEMNARLQVEHGVTELVTGLDLVALQLRIAAGERLPITQDDVRLSGHAIECRIYAEDPTRAYAPSSGRITYFLPPEGSGVRNDVGVADRMEVPAEYDPLLAKLLVHGASREEALARCRRAVDAYAVEGVKTNLGLLQAVLAAPEFAAGEADLTTLESMSSEDLVPSLPDDVLVAAAAADVLRAGDPAGADPWVALGAWRAGGRRPLEYTYHGGTFELELERVVGRSDVWRTKINGHDHEFTATVGDGGVVVITEAGSQSQWTVTRDGPRLILAMEERRYVLGRPARLSSGFAMPTAAAGAGALRAPMPGVVVRILVAEGERVAARQPLVLLEAMKMEHIIESSVAGVVRKIVCRVGAKVAEGDVLIELEGGEGRDDAAP